MFKSIGGTLDKKKKELIKDEKKTTDISVVFNKFLDEYFAEYKDLFQWEASYNPNDGRVFINTGSKLIAGELSLRIKELSQLLKESKIKATQIVIV